MKIAALTSRDAIFCNLVCFMNSIDYSLFTIHYSLFTNLFSGLSYLVQSCCRTDQA